MDMIKTKNPEIIEALIYTAILTMLVSRLVYNVIRRMVEAQGEDAVRYTSGRWSKVFCENASDNQAILFEYLGIRFSVLDKMEMEACQTRDPHVNRKRPRALLWA